MRSRALENSLTPIQPTINYGIYYTPGSAPIVPPKPRLGFFSMPGELRNTVYRLCFHKASGSHKTRESWQTARYASLDPAAVNPTTTFGAIGLLATCRLAHEEGSSVLYGENSFGFFLEVYHSRVTGVFLPDVRYGDAWPARRYLGWVKKLDVGVKFWCGVGWWRGVPEMFGKQMGEFREAYRVVWHDRGEQTH